MRPAPRPGWFPDPRCRRSCRRTWLAVNLLADPSSLLCDASNGRIAALSGLDVKTVRTYLRWLELSGVVQVLTLQGPRPFREPMPRRVIVLMDHPEAFEAIRIIERGGYVPSVYTRSSMMRQAREAVAQHPELPTIEHKESPTVGGERNRVFPLEARGVDPR